MRSIDTAESENRFVKLAWFMLALSVLWSVVGSTLWYANVSEFFIWYSTLYISLLILAELVSSNDSLPVQQQRLRETVTVGFLGWVIALVGYIDGWL